MSPTSSSSPPRRSKSSSRRSRRKNTCDRQGGRSSASDQRPPCCMVLGMSQGTGFGGGVSRAMPGDPDLQESTRSSGTGPQRKQRTYVTESPPNRPRSSPRPGVRPQTRENALRRPYTPLGQKRGVRGGFGWPNASQTPLSASAGRLGGLPEDRPGAASSPARKQRTYVTESATAPRRGTSLVRGTQKKKSDFHLNYLSRMS